MDFTCKCQTKAAATRRSPPQTVQQRLMLQLLHLLQPQLRPQRWRCPWLGNWDPMNGRNSWRPTGSCSHRQVGDGRKYEFDHSNDLSLKTTVRSFFCVLVELDRWPFENANYKSSTGEAKLIATPSKRRSLRFLAGFFFNHLPCVFANISTLHESSQQLARGVA